MGPELLLLQGELPAADGGGVGVRVSRRDADSVLHRLRRSHRSDAARMVLRAMRIATCGAARAKRLRSLRHGWKCRRRGERLVPGRLLHDQRGQLLRPAGAVLRSRESGARRQLEHHRLERSVRVHAGDDGHDDSWRPRFPRREERSVGRCSHGRVSEAGDRWGVDQDHGPQPHDCDSCVLRWSVWDWR